MNNILKNIETIRKEKRINQDVLAEMLGITQGTYSGYLTQNKDIRYGLLLDIANKMDVSVIDIITYPDKYVPQSEQCLACKEKDLIIRNLNEYINILKKK
jgi:transcriptional regulator with XRE-family HTH domain